MSKKYIRVIEIVAGISLLSSVLTAPAMALTPTPTPRPTSYPTATCNSGSLTIKLQPSGSTQRFAVRIDDRIDGWNETTPNPTDLINNNVHTSTFTYSPTSNPYIGRWVSWWVHSVDSNGTYSPAKGGDTLCPITAPTNLIHSYDHPYVTLSWKPVPGAKYYSIRVDNMSTPWSGDASNLYPGDHLINHLKATSMTFQAARDRWISWWVMAVSEDGVYSSSTGQYFYIPLN